MKLIPARELRKVIKRNKVEKLSSEEFRKEVSRVLTEINDELLKAKSNGGDYVVYPWFALDSDVRDVVIKKLKRAGYSLETTWTDGSKRLDITA